MLEAVWKHGVLFYAVGVMCILGIFSKIIVSLTLRRLVKEAGRMGKSPYPLMKLVRAKFEHACMVSDKVQNIRAFVDKYMYEYKVLWIKLHSWRQLEKVAAWCCLVFGVGGAAAAYVGGAPMETSGQYVAAGISGALLLFALRMITDEEYQLGAARNYMVEFLENTYARRYEKMSLAQEEKEFQNTEAEQQSKVSEKEQAAVLLEEVEEKSMPVPEKNMEFVQEEMEFSKEQEPDGIESDFVTLMKEEQKKEQEEEERKEKRKRDEEMIREILAEFLT